MPFALGLRDSLEFRQGEAETEFATGAELEEVLNRDLLTVEAMADGELITSVLLLSADGKRLYHGAGPRLPRPFRDAVDGSEIGPRAGSCGTAAYFNRAVYVRDIAIDPLWADYRSLALPHGLRSCWSTPIRNGAAQVIGTFAIYRRQAGDPSREEIESIDMITGHVSNAIMLASKLSKGAAQAKQRAPRLELVADNVRAAPVDSGSAARLLDLASKLEGKAGELDALRGHFEPTEADVLKRTSRLTHELVNSIRRYLNSARRGQS